MRLTTFAALAAVLTLAVGAPTTAAAGPVSSAPTAPAVRAEAPPRERPVQQDRTSDRVILTFRDGVTSTTRAGVSARHGLAAVARVSLTGAVVARVRAGSSPSAVAGALRREASVRHVEVDRTWSSLAADPLLSDYWGLDNRGQVVQGRQGVADVDVDAPEAWSTATGRDVVVAVLDSGVDVTHPDLAGSIWANTGEAPDNGVDDDGNGYVDDVHGWDFVHDDSSVFDAGDGDVHGTHVAGTVAASRGNGVGGAGVAPDVKIMTLKFLGPGGTGSTSDALRALDYAARMGARVVNASWGGPGYSLALEEAIRASGMAFVAAAGNSASDNDVVPQYPSGYDLDNVLSVAAVDNTGGLASFSNYGADSVDVGAPGVGILSTVPRAPAGTQALQLQTQSTRAMVWGFGLEDVVGVASRADAARRALAFLDPAGQAPVLLVDDDGRTGAADTARFYDEALQSAGLTSTTHVVPPGSSGPSRDVLAGKTVVWQTGDAEQSGPGIPNLTDADRAELSAFVTQGGRLLLAGADALYRVEQSAFVTDVLLVEHLDEGDTRTSLDGLPASAFAGAGYVADGGDSPDGQLNPYRDLLAPRGPAAAAALATPPMAYADAYGFMSGTSMATPHAAGVVALVASARPRADGAALVDAVATSGSPLPALAGVTRTGTLVRAPAALGCGTGPDADQDGVSDACDPVDDVVTTDVFAPFVEVLLRNGVTKGCGGQGDVLLYCPEQQVTRAQMAVFLLRALGVRDGTLPPYDGRFADVQDDFYGPWIRELSARGITRGCGADPSSGAPNYCPDAPVSREEMAVFLLRARGVAEEALPPYRHGFADVSGGSPYAPWIQELAVRRITLGCGHDDAGRPLYCPGAAVTRAQMAAFLVRNFSLA